MNNRTSSGAGELVFTDADFRAISKHAAQQYGLDIKIEKKGLIYARLARRIRAIGMSDFRSYCDMVTGPHAGAEQDELLSALTTNVTSFYRERHHFEILKKLVLPQLRSKALQGNKIRVWSAGCSAGQEPFSIAATIYDCWSDAGSLDIEILASDVDPGILKKAKTASYRASQGDGLSPEQRKGLFEFAVKEAGDLQIRQNIQKMVTFEQINLVSNWRHPAPFDFIFCRNVVIYFERATQHKLWRRFSDSLVSSGHLFIGHSERLSGPAESNFQNVGVTAFAKN